MIAFDFGGYNAHVNRFVQRVPSTLKGFIERIPYIAQAYIGSEMTDLGTEVVFNPGSQPGIRTGSVLRSLIQNQPYNIFKATVTPDGATLEYGTSHPGAHVNETGQPAIIKSKGKMERFFMAKYMQSKNRDYLIIALAIRKRGGIRGVRRKARPSLKPGIERMMQQGIHKLREDMIRVLIADWTRTING